MTHEAYLQAIVQAVAEYARPTTRRSSGPPLHPAWGPLAL